MVGLAGHWTGTNGERWDPGRKGYPRRGVAAVGRTGPSMRDAEAWNDSGRGDGGGGGRFDEARAEVPRGRPPLPVEEHDRGRLGRGGQAVRTLLGLQPAPEITGLFPRIRSSA